MDFGLRILGAAARLFGPTNWSAGRDITPFTGTAGGRRVGDTGVAAALIALGAKLAKADGYVSRAEISAFRNVFQSGADIQDGVARFFNLAAQTSLGYQAYAKIVFRKYRVRPDILEDVLDGLFHIALADGSVSDEEAEFLQNVGDIFRFDHRTFSRIRIAHMGRASDDPYLILGVEEDINDEDLKKAYRLMASSNHPDRLMARGLPQELQELATHKMAMINQAYAQIIKSRKGSGTPTSQA